jgi:hypothetical protein
LESIVIQHRYDHPVVTLKSTPVRYLMATAASVLIESQEVPAKEVLKDVADMTKGQMCDISPAHRRFAGMRCVHFPICFLLPADPPQLPPTIGVQHPMRGLFLRNYLSNVTKDKLPDLGTKYEGEGGNVNDAIEFLLQGKMRTRVVSGVETLSADEPLPPSPDFAPPPLQSFLRPIGFGSECSTKL